MGFADDIRAAAEARAAESSQETPPETEALEPEGGSPDGGTPSTEETTPSGAEGETETEEVEEEAEGTEGEFTFPEDYMGFDLTVLDPEEAQSLYDRLRENDKFTQSILRRNKELEAQATQQVQQPPQTEPEESGPPDVEEVLKQLYGDPEEDEFWDIKAEAARPLLNALLPLAETVQSMQQRSAAEEFLDDFDNKMEAIEKDYGLPEGVTRDDVLDYMIENNIDDPELAYFRATSDVRRELTTATREARQRREEAKREAKKRVSTPRPRGGGGSEPTNPKGLSVREAALAAAKETGVNLDNAHKLPWAGSV